MQWKSPYDIGELVGLNDYKVKVRVKRKVYHANLLKKYLQHDVASAMINEKIVPEAEAADVEPVTDHDCSEDLVEIGGYTAKESIDNVPLAPNLTEVQKTEFMCTPIFKLIHRGSRYHKSD